jgi:alpha-1,2-mannosyltransferase
MILRPASRPPPLYLVYAIATTAAIAAFVYLLIWARGNGLDLLVYRDSVDYWRAGGDPYTAAFTHSRLNFTYPPFALLALSPLAWVPFGVAQLLLWVTSIAAGTGSVVLVLRNRGIMLTPRTWCGAVAWSCVSVFALEPMRSEFGYGQIELLLMAAVVADLLLVRPPYRGVLTGIAAAIKLTPLVFIIVLVVSRDTRSVIRAAGSFLACSALSWLLWPGLSRKYWLHDLLAPGRVGGITYAGNQSWYAILHRPPFPATGSFTAWLLLVLLTLAISSFVAWRLVSTGHRALAIVPVALAGLLVSPISWSHHWIWVMLIPPMLIPRRTAAVTRPVQVLLWGLVAVTVLGPYWWLTRGTVAVGLDAVLPLWAGAVLAAWAVSCAPRRAWPATLHPWPARRREVAPEMPASGPAARR